MDQYPVEEHMGEEITVEEVASNPNACVDCGANTNPLLRKTRTVLCDDCYQYYVRYPIPKWIMLFGGGILLLMLVSFFRLPSAISTAVHFKKGKQAAAAHRYNTAQNEFAMVVAKEPDYLEAKVRLMLAAFHNGDMATFVNTYKQVRTKSFDEDLQNEASSELADLGNYFPSDSLSDYLDKHHAQLSQLSADELKGLSARYPDDAYLQAVYVRSLSSLNEYATADTQLNKLLTADPQFRSALNLKISVKRELNQFDSAHYYFRKLMALNSESSDALSIDARVLLKEKRDAEALQEAQKAVALNPKDGYVQATLALVYHFMGRTAERDATFAKAAADSSSADGLQYVRDIFSGKKSFRN